MPSALQDGMTRRREKAAAQRGRRRVLRRSNAHRLAHRASGHRGRKPRVRYVVAQKVDSHGPDKRQGLPKGPRAARVTQLLTVCQPVAVAVLRAQIQSPSITLTRKMGTKCIIWHAAADARRVAHARTQASDATLHAGRARHIPTIGNLRLVKRKGVRHSDKARRRRRRRRAERVSAEIHVFPM